MEAAIAWYRDVLGFELARRFELPGGVAKGAMLQRGEMQMELFQPDDPAPLQSARRHPDQDVKLLGNKHVAFRVQDMEGWVDWLDRKGGDIAHRVTGLFGSALFVRDCAGNLIEFLSRPQIG
jgi:methylmalonyl-CoA/ethylmalonyl-CoA epimerase